MLDKKSYTYMDEATKCNHVCMESIEPLYTYFTSHTIKWGTLFHSYGHGHKNAMSALYFCHSFCKLSLPIGSSNDPS